MSRDERQRYDEGMKVRRAVLGDPYVDRAVAGKSPLTADFQDYITRMAWGDVWTRPGLDRKTRSVVVLASTVSLGNWEEFRIHVRGAIHNGVTPAELAEILMQLAVYAGVPRANTAFKEAKAVLAEMGVQA
jgi:4-carboxymuconolactone decarboxylase